MACLVFWALLGAPVIALVRAEKAPMTRDVAARLLLAAVVSLLWIASGISLIVPAPGRALSLCAGVIGGTVINVGGAWSLLAGIERTD